MHKVYRQNKNAKFPWPQVGVGVIGLRSSSQRDGWCFIFCHDADHRRAIRDAMRALEVSTVELNCLRFRGRRCGGGCEDTVWHYVILLASALPALSLDPEATSLITGRTMKYSQDVLQNNISHFKRWACKGFGVVLQGKLGITHNKMQYCWNVDRLAMLRGKGGHQQSAERLFSSFHID